MSAFTKSIITEKLKAQYPLMGTPLEDMIRYVRRDLAMFDSDIARGFCITPWQRESLAIYVTEFRRRKCCKDVVNEIETRLKSLAK